MNGKWQIDLRRTAWSTGLELRMGFLDLDGRFSVARPIVMETLTEEQRGAIIPPCALLTLEAAQTLMDELWHAGIRPTEGTGSAGSLAATERHLADMKAIAFHALKLPTT